MSNAQQASVLGKEIERTRREHKLSTTVLAMLAGLTDAQVQAIEEGSSAAFVDEEHRIDCARRIAVAMGLATDHFLQFDTPPVAPRRIVRQQPGDRLARDAWEHLPVAGLDVLATLKSTELPPEPHDQRRGSPIVIALTVSLVLAALMAALATLH